MDNSLKTIFCGTPDFAVPFLQSLISDKDFAVVGVITQPDKPTGRKQVLAPPPVKELAEKNNLKIWQPTTLKNNRDLVESLKNFQPDLMVVVAYGLIIPKEILDIPKYGALNVHPSLLPKCRGASPVQSAILNGDQEAGVTIMLMDEKMDHGPILTQEKIELTGEETNESLHNKLADIGKKLLINTIKNSIPIKNSHLTKGGRGGVAEWHFKLQNDADATYCKIIIKEEARIDWSKSAMEIERQIRAFYPWPVAWTILDGKRLKIFPLVKILPLPRGDARRAEGLPGKIFFNQNQLAVLCGQNAIIISKLQLEGKKEMTAQEFLRGQKNILGKISK